MRIIIGEGSCAPCLKDFVHSRPPSKFFDFLRDRFLKDMRSCDHNFIAASVSMIIPRSFSRNSSLILSFSKAAGFYQTAQNP